MRRQSMLENLHREQLVQDTMRCEAFTNLPALKIAYFKTARQENRASITIAEHR
jgi:hypothetical protein